MAIDRVRTRVPEGGHNIPEEVIVRRYLRGIENLPYFIAITNYWFILNNSGGALQFVAEGNLDEITIFDQDIWAKLS